MQILNIRRPLQSFVNSYIRVLSGVVSGLVLAAFLFAMVAISATASAQVVLSVRIAPPEMCIRDRLLALAMRNLPFPPAETSAESSAASSWRELVKSPAIWIFAAVFFLYPGAETAVGGWIGSYVSRLGSHGVEMASMMPAFFWSALTVGRALGTAFLRHFSERRVLRAEMCIRDRSEPAGLEVHEPGLDL